MTRIIAGAAKGRRLTVPSTGTRPSADRVREALFSSLGSRLGAWAGVRVLDLYAGSGALGLEALSRGAAKVLLVERDRHALAALRSNADAVGLAGSEVRAAEVSALAGGPATEAYDLVLADPPYDLAGGDLQGVLRDLGARGWLSDGAIVVVERGTRGRFDWPPGYRGRRETRYGGTLLLDALWYGRDDTSVPPP